MNAILDFDKNPQEVSDTIQPVNVPNGDSITLSEALGNIA